MKWLSYSALALIGLFLASAAVHAQQSSSNQNVTPLAEWQDNNLNDMDGIRAEYLISEEVFSPKGEEIGNIHDAIIGSGHIVAIIVEVDGFLGFSETYLAIPWEKVTLKPDGVQIPVTAENFRDFQLFDENSFVTMESLQQPQQVDDTLATGVETWRLTALLNDYVALETGVGYGIVDDIIFSKEGKIKAVIVQSTVEAYGYGAYAYPFYGFAWEPYNNLYTLPYGPDEIGVMEPFDHDAFDGYWY